jgi:hypothetical protein
MIHRPGCFVSRPAILSFRIGRPLWFFGRILFQFLQDDLYGFFKLGIAACDVIGRQFLDFDIRRDSHIFDEKTIFSPDGGLGLIVQIFGIFSFAPPFEIIIRISEIRKEDLE